MNKLFDNKTEMSKAFYGILICMIRKLRAFHFRNPKDGKVGIVCLIEEESKEEVIEENQKLGPQHVPDFLFSMMEKLSENK